MTNPRPVARRARFRLALPAVIVALALALAACGGDGGGDNNPANQQHLQVMVINLSSADVTATSTSGGDPQKVAQCTAVTVDFPLSDPFVFSLDDKPVIDSSQLEGGVPGGMQSTVLAQITIGKDGTPKVDKQAYAGRTGGLAPPSKLYIQSSCSGKAPPEAS
jgi:hypothetical protein